MCFLAQKFQRVTFFLQRIGFRIGRSEHMQGACLHFDTLSFSHRLHQQTFHLNGSTRCDWLKLLVRKILHVENNLQVLHSRAVVQGHELHMFVSTTRTHPTHNGDLGSDKSLVGNQVIYFVSFHLSVLYYIMCLFIIRKNPFSGNSLPPE